VEIVGNMMKGNYFSEHFQEASSAGDKMETAVMEHIQTLYELVDEQVCKLELEEFEELMQLHVAALILALKTYFTNAEEPEKIKASYQRKMRLLSYGAYPRRTEEKETQRKDNDMGKIGKFLGGAVVVGALGAAVFFRLNQEEVVMEAIPDPTVRVENPVKATVELQTGLTGTVTAEESVYVIATGSGEVLEVYAKLGDYVEKDQALFKIDNLQLDSAKIQLDAAKIQLQDAQTNLNRMQVLYESGDIAAQAYEQVKSGVEAAKLQVKGLQLAYDAQMDATVVKAPISGRLESFNVVEKNMLSAGMVGVISSEGSKTVNFAVTERVQQGIKVGDPFTVEKNGLEYHGTITEVGTMVDMQTGLFMAKAALEDAAGIANGSMVKLYVTAQKAEDVLTVPANCVNYDDGEAFVYTYDAESGLAKKVFVEDGLVDAEKIEIESGLDYDDQVIVSWTRELYDGASVVAEFAE
ncbi:MAG: efflux RND transporter periplasmic adaptor subunit, partial [Lachnospiraceae bacterium]|nr:efflux RND transporter periplasmic adaptor subunit [Lachnospiraceae bacterium]